MATDERIETLRQAVTELTAAVAAHIVTHNTGGSIIDRVAPEPLARAKGRLEDADEQCPC